MHFRGHRSLLYLMGMWKQIFPHCVYENSETMYFAGVEFDAAYFSPYEMSSKCQ